jgi:hypothetical protein
VRRPIVLATVAAAPVVLYLWAFVYAVAYAAIRPTPVWWRAAFALGRTGDLSWLVLLRAVGVLIVSIPFAIAIARLYRGLAVPVALAVAAMAWGTVEASTLVQEFGSAGPYIRGLLFANSLELLGFLPILVWLVRCFGCSKRTLDDSLSDVP